MMVRYIHTAITRRIIISIIIHSHYRHYPQEISHQQNQEEEGKDMMVVLLRMMNRVLPIYHSDRSYLATLTTRMTCLSL